MILEKFNPGFPALDDGFPIESDTPWTFQKNEIIHRFLQEFTSTMRRKYNYLVYLDLFAGSGLKNLGGYGYTYGSPVIAMSGEYGFSKHILCESNSNLSDALRIRVNKYFRNKNTVIFKGNPNELIDKLAYYVPDSSQKYRVSTICLIDPFSMDLDFETLRALSELGVNFLLVMALPWSGKDHFKEYMEVEREKLNSFLGMPWSQAQSDQNINSNEAFFRLLVKSYHQNLKLLGYDAEGSFYPIDELSNVEAEVPFFFAGLYRYTGTNKSEPTDLPETKSSQVNLFESSPISKTPDTSL